jgi:lipopolysaccharide transport system ATP-binding protein
MSSEPGVAIRARGVSKLYRRGQMSSSGLLAERLNDAVVSPVRRLLGRGPSTVEIITDAEQEAPETDEFWALRDVSFDVHYGEAVGIIGRNGAGKSTMLKLLSRITLPTEGRIELHGRTTSLLEVGTGFHPELTGRENIFLNGTLLGLSRWDIFERYEEIVDFSGIRPFIDTPVKRYSSGMFVRLAFSVAAHLDPEILIIDEVLAVGDMDFQRRSLEKMHQTAVEGRTVVFVSHDLASVESLCDRVLVLEGGKIVSESRAGHPHDAVDDYVGLVNPSGPTQRGGVREVPSNIQRWGTGESKIVEIALRDLEGRPIRNVAYGQPFAISVVYDWSEAVAQVAYEVGISRTDGQRIVTAQSIDGPSKPVDVFPGRQEVTVTFTDTYLLPGEFTIDAGCHRMDGNTIDIVNNLLSFEALNGPEGDDRYEWPGVRGYVRPASVWHGHDIQVSGPRRESHG